VSAGDDCDAPHELVLPLRDESLRSFASRLLGESYLASIASGRATWILQTDRQAGRSLAVVAQQWSQPRFLVDPESPVSSYIQRDSSRHLYVPEGGRGTPQRAAGAWKAGMPQQKKYGRDDKKKPPNK